MNKIKIVKVKKEQAQKEIEKLKEKGMLESGYKITKQEKHVLIPVKKDYKGKSINIQTQINKKEIKMDYKKILEKEISKEILSELPTSYDLLGDILIIDIKKELLKKQLIDKISQALKKVHPHIKVILNKKKKHHGVYRTQNLKWLSGEKRKHTKITENKCVFKTDVEKVFFSTRLVNERKRITSLIKRNETVGVFFAGVGPFAIQIAKAKNKPKQVIAIELNPIAVDYLLENIKLNKVEENVKGIKGDVKKVYKKYKEYFDRVVMPLPKSAEDFLKQAIYCVKNKGIVHVYNFVPKNTPFQKITELLAQKEKENKCKIKIVDKKVIRSFSATTVQIVLDLRIIK